MRIIGRSACTALLLALSTASSAVPGVLGAQGIIDRPSLAKSFRIRKSALSLPARQAIETGQMLTVSANGMFDTIPSRATEIRLQPGEMLMGRVSAASTPVDPATLIDLARRTGVPISDSVVASDFPLILLDKSAGELRPYVFGSMLQFEQNSRRFAGRVHIGLRMVGGAASGPMPLETPIRFTLVTDADSIDPSRLEFREANGAPTAVTLATGTSLDSVIVRMTRDDAQGYEVTTGVALSSVLYFEGPPRRLQGFGLEKRTLSLAVRGRRLTAPVVVAVSADAGVLDSSAVHIEPGGVATVSLTADALDTIRLSASGQGVGPTMIKIESTLPIRFSLAALLGALLGAATAYFSASGKKAAANWKLALGAGLGGLIGVVVGIGLGLNVTFFQTSGPINTTLAVLALAALGAWGGLKIVPGNKPD